MIINMRKIILGKGGISAKIIADSISPTGIRISTLELIYHRFIHSEFMTHRQFSRNSASSRAIPILKMNELIRKRPSIPIFWGKNQRGMQTSEEFDELVPINLGDSSVVVKMTPDEAWKYAMHSSLAISEAFSMAGCGKEIANRHTEPYQMMKVVCTATEFENFFALRLDKAAQREIQELARVMKEALNSSDPDKLRHGEWHLPYVSECTWEECVKYADEKAEDPKDIALMVSASCCAQVSYRLLDTSVEKAIRIYKRLIESYPPHASPFEHQASPLKDPSIWTGNFRGWHQYRHYLEGKEMGKFYGHKRVVIDEL